MEHETSLNHEIPPAAKPLLGARVSFISKVLICQPTLTGKVVFESENYVKILPDDRRIGYAYRKKNEVERV